MGSPIEITKRIRNCDAAVECGSGRISSENDVPSKHITKANRWLKRSRLPNPGLARRRLEFMLERRLQEISGSMLTRIFNFKET